MTINILEIKKKAIDLMSKLNIKTYPVKICQYIDKLPNCKISTYSEFCTRSNITIENAINQLGSSDAVIIKNKDKYILFYNNFQKNKQRILWSLAHEIGHMILGHLTDSDCTISSGLSKKKYKQYEAEANMFAAELLSNLFILHAFNVNSAEDIASICFLSKEASNNRFKTYKKWKVKMNINNEDYILFNLLDKYCNHCGIKYTKSDFRDFCPICGEKLTLNNKKVDNMIYDDGYELDKYCKAIECPNCKNSEEHRGVFCAICGENLINKCTNPACGELADGNARYCVHCGASTTFYNQNYLCDYKDFNKNKYIDGNSPQGLELVDIPF